MYSRHHHRNTTCDDDGYDDGHTPMPTIIVTQPLQTRTTGVFIFLLNIHLLTTILHVCRMPPVPTTVTPNAKTTASIIVTQLLQTTMIGA